MKHIAAQDLTQTTTQKKIMILHHFLKGEELS